MAQRPERARAQEARWPMARQAQRAETDMARQGAVADNGHGLTKTNAIDHNSCPESCQKR